MQLRATEDVQPTGLLRCKTGTLSGKVISPLLWMKSWDAGDDGGLGVRSSKGFSFSIQIMATVYFGQFEIPYSIPTQYKVFAPYVEQDKAIIIYGGIGYL